MKIDESVKIKVQKLYNDIQLLKDGHIYEIDSVPGNPKASTMAVRMKEHLDVIVNAIKEAEKE